MRLYPNQQIRPEARRVGRHNYGARSMRRHIIFQEAEAWLFDRYGTEFMSCQIVCESLGIEPIQLRRYLRKWKLNNQAGLAAPPVRRVRLKPTDLKITWPATCASSSKRGQKRTGGMRI